MRINGDHTNTFYRLIKTIMVLAVWCLFSLLQQNNCLALPEVDRVVSGSVNFVNINDHTLQVNASDKAIINYRSFNIAENESLIYNLPSSTNEILNRVTGPELSSLLGQLSCNGTFILVNPNGIYIGPNARIDVGSLVASTRDITNENFLKSQYVFEKFVKDKPGAIIQNLGKITIRQGGFGVLIAGAIENQGAIIATVGKIALASGDQVRLGISNNGLIGVAVEKEVAEKILDINGNPITDQIKNSGTIDAAGGVVLIRAETAAGLFKTAINLEGRINADSVSVKDGVIEITSNRDIRINGFVSAGSVTVKAGGSIEAQGITANELKLTAQSFQVNAQSAITTQIYKTLGDLYIQNAKPLSNNLISLEGDKLNVIYDRNNNLILNSDNAVNTAAGVIISAGQIQVNARYFGAADTPLNLDASDIIIQRIDSNIDLLSSQGIGTSVLLRGPPDGFGAIICNKDSNLTLQAPNGSINLAKDVTLDTNDLTLEAGDQIYSEGALIADKNLRLLAGGAITTLGSLKTTILTERGYSYLAGGTNQVDYASIINEDNAVTYNTGSFSGAYTDANYIYINTNAVITLTGNVVFRADSDANGSGGFVMNAGSSIIGDGYDLSLYASGAAVLRSISGVGTLSLSSSNGGLVYYTAQNNISANNFIINPNADFNAKATTLNISGNWTNNGSFNARTSTVILNDTGSQQVTTGGASSTFNILNVDNTSADGVQFLDPLYAVTLNINGKAVLGADAAGIGSATINSGASLDLAGHNIVATGGITNNGSLYLLGNETIAGALTNNTLSTVEYQGTDSYTGLAAGNNYYNLTFNGTGSWNLNQDLNIANDLNINTGTLNANVGTITLAGNWVNNGSFDPGTSTVIFNGTTSTSGINDISFCNLTINPDSTLTAPSPGNIYVSGNWTNNGSFNAGASIVTLNGSGSQQVITGGAASGFNVLNVDNMGPDGVQFADPLYAVTLNINGKAVLGADAAGIGSATINSGASLDLAGHNIVATGGITNNGSLYLLGNETIAGALTNNTLSAVEYRGDGVYTGLAAGNNYYDVNFSGTGNWTLNAAMNVSNVLKLGGATLNTSNKNLVVNGAIIGDNGGFTVTGGTISLTSATITNNGNAINIAATNNISINANAIITLTGDVILRADSDANGTGGFTMNLGSSIIGAGHNLSIYSSGAAVLRSISDIGTLSFFSSTGGLVYYTAQNNISANNLTMNPGVDFNAKTNTFTIFGNWTNNAAFHAKTSTVILNGSGLQQVVTGGAASGFNILTVNNASADGIQFADALYANILNANAGVQKLSFVPQDGIVHTIITGFNVSGSSGQLLELAPSVADQVWHLDAPSSTVNYVKLSYCSEASGKVITANNSINAGFNIGWDFGLLVFSGTGLWSQGDLWSVGIVPGLNDTVIIDGACTLDSSVSGLESLTINSGASLDLAGHNISTADGITNNGSLYLLGNETITGTLTNNGLSTVEYRGTDSYTSLAAGNDYYNLSFAGGNWNTTAALNINNDLAIGTGVLLNIDNNSISVVHAVSGPGKIFTSGTGSNICLPAGANLVFGAYASELPGNSYASLELAQGGRASGDIIVTANLAIASGAELIMGNNRLEAAGAVFTNNGTLTLGAGALDLTSALFTNNGTLNIASGALAGLPQNISGTVNFTAANTIPANTNFSGTLNIRAPANTVTAGGNLRAVSLNIEQGTFDAGDATLLVSGNWTNNGTFYANTSTVILNGSDSQQVITGGAASGFNILTVNNTSADGVQFADALYTNTLNANAGVQKLGFAAGSGIVHTINSVLNVSGTSDQLLDLEPITAEQIWYLNAPASTVNYVQTDYCSAANRITANNSINLGNNTGWDFGILTFSGTGYWSQTNLWSTGVTPVSGDTVIVDGNCTLNGSVSALESLTINAERFLDLAGYNMGTINGITNNGTLYLLGNETITGTLTNNGLSAVEYRGDGVYTGLAAGNNYYDVNFSGTGNWGLTGDLNVNNDLNIKSGTLTANTNTINLSGNWINNGIFDAGAGTVIFNGSAPGKTITAGSSPFWNVIINGQGGYWTAVGTNIAFNTLTASAGTLQLSNVDFTVNDIIITEGALISTAAGRAFYYVDSTGGNNSYNGYSPANAWKTIGKVNSATFSPGDTVLFRRGGTWREQLVPDSGSEAGYITYTAYGPASAPLPLLLGSVNANNASGWTNLGNDIWQYKNSLFNVDVGNLIFNNEANVGFKKWTAGELKTQGDFWYDRANKAIRLYSTDNPATVYSNIECALRNNIISIGGKHHVIIENLDLRYGGAHGIGGSSTSYIIIQDMHISFIGGGDQNQNGKDTIRYGNGIEFFDNSHDTIVRRSVIDNIYDAGITTQGTKAGNTKYNQYFYDNIISNCEYSFEYFDMTPDGSSITHDIYVDNNTFINAGGSWAHSQRPTQGLATHFMIGYDNGKLSNFNIRNNIAYSSLQYAIIFNNPKNIPAFNMDYNLYYSATGKLALIQSRNISYAYSQFASWKSAYGKDSHSIVADPLLGPQYVPTSGSPVIDRGIALPYIELDYAKKQRLNGAAVDIGAYEY